MRNYIIYSFLTIILLLPVQVFAGHYDPPYTDEASDSLFSFIDLRDRESFVQVTNTDSITRRLHIQIFNVDQNCNENNFFDTFTPNDTHVYNMRDILTNDGNPSGVVLPENTYGFVAISIVDDDNGIDDEANYLIGNFRVLDNLGYEYRTNSAGRGDGEQPDPEIWTFNFNNRNGVSLSDIIFIAVEEDDGEWVAGPTDAYWALDVDIYNLDEVPFSCRNVIFSCVDADNPLLEELISGESGSGGSAASVAAFEYGINEVIPHSRGGELLCPGNIISEGFVRLDGDDLNNNGDARAAFIGLNNGNGRGSMDSFWQPSCFEADTCDDN